MDNNAADQTRTRLTLEMLGLVKRSSLETQQKPTLEKIEQTASNGVKAPEDHQPNDAQPNDAQPNDVQPNDVQPNDVQPTNGKPQENDDEDIKIINEKINTIPPKQEPVKKEEVQEEKIEVKLKPEEFILDDEEVGFPGYLKGWVQRGRTIPINKKTWTEIEIDGNDAILECPSQIVQLFVKKPHLFPLREEKDSKKEADESKSDEEDGQNENGEVKREEDEPKEGDSKEADSKDGEEKKPTNGENASETATEKKPAADLNKNAQTAEQKMTMLTIDDYYKSSVGSFLMGIGLRRCQETYLKDSVKATQKLIKKEGELDEHVNELKKQQEQLDDCKTVNSIFTFKQNKCSMCDFKTDTDSVMQHHMTIPHLTNRKEFKCNFCTFLTRDSRVIVYHFLKEHKSPCNIEMPLQLYTCPTCNYESNQKAKAANHMAKCATLFHEDKVLQTIDAENELPAITSKLITQDDLKNYEATVQALKPVVTTPGTPMPVLTGLPRGLQQQILVMQQQAFARQKVVKPPAKQTAQAQRANLTHIRPNNLANVANILNSQTTITALAAPNGANIINNLSFAKTNAPQLYHMLQTGSTGQLINLQPKPQSVTLPATTSRIQATRTIVPPIASAAIVQKNMQMNNSKPAMMITKAKEPNGAAKSETFVICEICDGYIKDLEQLRTHMQWIHKVSASFFLWSLENKLAKPLLSFSHRSRYIRRC